jgi:hypothetical protein
MNLFGSKKTENKTTDNQNITPDILSQVRVMGEKARPAMGANTVPSTLPTSDNLTANPVSNPFVHDEVIPAVDPVTIAEPASIAPSQDPTPLEEPIKVEKTQHEHTQKILIVGSILTVGLILIIGIFLYIEKTKDAEVIEPVAIEAPQDLPEPPSESTDTPVLEKEAFSTTRSNYFPLDPETATKDSILAEISALEQRILESSTAEPIVFQVTDQNNIPLAMSRFAYLMELGPGEDILTALDEDFTFVLYKENGQIRRGLATKFKEEQENPAELLKKGESLLPATFRNMLYPADIVLPTGVQFSTGSYNNSVVRYSNLVPDKNYSFDYILQDKLLFIGNSKDVTRKTLEVGVR